MAGKSMPRPRPWIVLDQDYLAQDTIAELRHAFGPAGPLAFLALILEARKQGSAGKRERGLVDMRYSALALQVGCSPDDARGILKLAADIGLLELQDEGTRFKARSLKREAWEPKDPTAAERQARQRKRYDWRAEIVTKITAAGHPLRLAEIAEALNVDPDSGSLKRELRAMHEAGELSRPRHGLYALADTDPAIPY